MILMRKVTYNRKIKVPDIFREKTAFEVPCSKYLDLRSYAFHLIDLLTFIHQRHPLAVFGGGLQDLLLHA